jgi:hypothetical protein
MEQLTFSLFNDWLPFPSNSAYWVHQSGQVRKGSPDSWQILKPVTLKSGYQQVTINGHKKYLHRIVASTFLGEIKPGFEPDHGDRVRNNNHVDNLEIISHRENCLRRGKPINQKYCCVR